MIASKSVDPEKAARQEAVKIATKKISKFSWSDEETKVKIYIDLA